MRTRPLSGISLGRTQSYADMRSLATMTRSPASFRYRSRTLPVWRWVRPGTCTGSGFSTNPDTVPPRRLIQERVRFSRTSGRPRPPGPVTPRSVPLADPVEEVRGGALDPGVDMARTVERRRPGEGAGGEDPGTGGRLVERGLLVADRSVAVPVGRVGQQDAALVLGERGAREVAVGLARDQAGELVAVMRRRWPPRASARRSVRSAGAVRAPGPRTGCRGAAARAGRPRARGRGGPGRAACGR